MMHHIAETVRATSMRAARDGVAALSVAVALLACSNQSTSLDKDPPDNTETTASMTAPERPNGETAADRAQASAPATEKLGAPAPPWQLTYADGSANRYEITRATGDGAAHFKYIPMTPMRSSSGTYSGGDPASGPLDAAQTARLWSLVRTLKRAPDKHAPTRTKGTGSLSFTTQRGSERLLITSEAARTVDAMLKEFKASSTP